MFQPRSVSQLTVIHRPTFLSFIFTVVRRSFAFNFLALNQQECGRRNLKLSSLSRRFNSSFNRAELFLQRLCTVASRVALYKLDCYCYEYYNNLTMHLFETVHDYQETSGKKIEINQKVSSEKILELLQKLKVMVMENIYFSYGTYFSQTTRHNMEKDLLKLL